MTIQNKDLDSINAELTERENQERENSEQDKVIEKEAEQWRNLNALIRDREDSGRLSNKGSQTAGETNLALASFFSTVCIFALCQGAINSPSFNYQNLIVAPVTSMMQPAFTKLTLKAEKSMITGIIDPRTLTSSLYWTVDFKNISGSPQEAQAEIRLPEGAVVSRATLWINGIPEEAAFNTTEKVTQAYTWVTVKHRDPLLVTYKDKNTIVIKASPVPTNGEPMRIRLGITAPMTCVNNVARLGMPSFKESNFGLPDKTTVHLESKDLIDSQDHKLNAEFSPSGKHVLNADLAADAQQKTIVTSSVTPQTLKFAVRATHSLPGSYICSNLDEESDDSVAKLERIETEPVDYHIVRSEEAAHRVSTLWAGRQIALLLDQGQTREAQDLAQTFRLVSPVSGAVILERASDYTFNGLDRDRYRVSKPGPIAIGQSQGQSNPKNISPSLQGATNGSIASLASFFDQSSARDAKLFDDGATFVQGVNTAGTVRPDEIDLWTAAQCSLIFGIYATAFITTFSAMKKLFAGAYKGSAIDLLIAASIAFYGLYALPALALMKGYQRIASWLKKPS